jgi:hypothetical protein
VVAVVALASLVGFLVMAPAPAVRAGSTPFTDISSSIFKADIEWLYGEGITAGCTATKYCPEDVVTRDQMASFLKRMFNLATTTNDYFTDDEGSIHEADINRLAAAGITSGCTATTYCPKDPVSRAQMASFIARAAELTVGAGRNYFYDDNGNTHEANIDRSAAAGIASGCGQWRYCPKGTVTRGQMAAFLHRIVSPVTPPPYPAPPPPTATPTPAPNCAPSYPTHCIPPPPPTLNCDDIPWTNFTVKWNVPEPDPHGFDGNHNGIGCEA